MNLSVVTTLYKSAAYIEEFHRRVSDVACQFAGKEYEIIFVNDGSPDNSLDIAVQLTKNDPKVVVIDLSRNFGHHKAMMTGLAHSCGEQVFLIDSDLEEEPELLLSFSKQIEQEHCDVVYGVQTAALRVAFFERWSGQCFYRLFNALSGLNLPKNIVTARLMTRRYVDSLLLHKEREVMISGLWYITGFDQNPQTIKKHCTSETTYSFPKKMSHLINGVTSFSNVPLVIIFYIGVSISILDSVYIFYLIIQWMFLAKPLSGWTSLMASIWLLGGLIISFIGIVGIYLSKIFSEIKQRPYTIVRRIYARPTDSTGQ